MKNYMKDLKKGLKRDHKKHADFKDQAHKHLTALSVLPGSTKFRGTMAPPMNQNSCGGCWAFSTTNTLYSQLLLAGYKNNPLAINYLINNCGGVANEDGCNGGDFDAGLNMLNGKGPWLESQDPFTGCDGGQCKPGLPVAGTALRWVVVGDGKSRPTAQQLCEAIWNDGKGRCLSVDVAADDTWSNYSSGIYDKNTSQEIDHMVRIVDYDAQTSVDAKGNAVFNPDGSFKNGDGFFYVRNNWDTDWGENGDMRSRYGANNLAETAMFFEVAPITTMKAELKLKPVKWWIPFVYLSACILAAGLMMAGLSYLMKLLLGHLF